MLNRTLFCVLSAAFCLAACSDKSSTITPPGSKTHEDPGPPAGAVYAVPQEELCRMEDAVKVTGTIVVKDYESGLLQIDVTLPVEGTAATPQGVPPITVARYKNPGPFELCLPPKTEAVNLTLILDVRGNGPDAEDPKTVYADNPLEIDGPLVSGIEFTIDKTKVVLPPSPPPGGPEGEKEADSGQLEPSEPESGVDALSEASGTAAGSKAATPQPSAARSKETSSSSASISGSTSTSPGTSTSDTASQGSGSPELKNAVSPPTPDPLDESLDTVPGKAD